MAVVGVAKTIKYQTLGEAPQPALYVIDQSLWIMKIAGGLLAVFSAIALALASIGVSGWSPIQYIRGEGSSA